MIEIDGEFFYIDFQAIEDLLNLNNDKNPTGGLVDETETREVYGINNELISREVVTSRKYKSREVNSFRYEAIRNMVDLVMMESLGEPESDLPKADEDLDGKDLAFKFAFNTLIQYGILTVPPKSKVKK